MERGTASSIELGQFAEFTSAVIRQLPRDLTPDVAQGWIENQGALQRVLRGALMSGEFVLAPQGGTLHFVSVPVDESRPWDEAVRTAGPNTPDEYNVWKVGDQYPPQGESGVREIILVNFGRGSFTTGEQALAWGKENRLRPASPRGCFAVGEHCPKLNRELGKNYMAVVSLDLCSFGGERQVCNVWWNDTERGANLNWVDDEFDDDYWLAFVRYSFHPPLFFKRTGFLFGYCASILPTFYLYH